MRIEILTLFPEMFQGPFNQSLLKKAQETGLLSLKTINIREFAEDKHRTVDDTPYGGGPGMVMKPDVLWKAISRQRKAESRVILMCPTGNPLTHEKVAELALQDHLIILCGHYEGFDERVRALVDEEISIGDYVLTGGEIPAIVLTDAVARQMPGVVKEIDSVKRDSFYDGLLDYPSYTKPEDFQGRKVPPVLLSGNHKEIEAWRRKAALRRTFELRPELLAQTALSENDRKLLKEIIEER